MDFTPRKPPPTPTEPSRCPIAPIDSNTYHHASAAAPAATALALAMHADTDVLAERLEGRMAELLAGYRELNHLAAAAPQVQNDCSSCKWNRRDNYDALVAEDGHRVRARVRVFPRRRVAPYYTPLFLSLCLSLCLSLSLSLFTAFAPTNVDTSGPGGLRGRAQRRGARHRCHGPQVWRRRVRRKRRQPHARARRHVRQQLERAGRAVGRGATAGRGGEERGAAA
jgi:hypothetical protein